MAVVEAGRHLTRCGGHSSRRQWQWQSRLVSGCWLLTATGTVDGRGSVERRHTVGLSEQLTTDRARRQRGGRQRQLHWRGEQSGRVQRGEEEMVGSGSGGRVSGGAGEGREGGRVDGEGGHHSNTVADERNTTRTSTDERRVVWDGECAAAATNTAATDITAACCCHQYDWQCWQYLLPVAVWQRLVCRMRVRRAVSAGSSGCVSVAGLRRQQLPERRSSDSGSVGATK